MKLLMIGDLAAATGTKVNTIRYYEDIGLMPVAVRTQSGRRTYGRSELLRLTFIRHARALGFSIDEVRSLLALSNHPDRDCSDAAAIASHHLTDVDDRIARLQQLRAELKPIADSCSGRRAADCNIITAIAAR